MENQNNDFYQTFAGSTSRKRPNPLQPPRDGESDCTAMSPTEFQNLISAGALSTLIDQFAKRGADPMVQQKHSSATSAMFDHIEEFEDPTYLINQLYYTDSEKAVNSYLSEVTRGRQNWLQDAYKDFLPEQRSRRQVKINNLMSEQSSSAAAAAQPDDSELPSGPKMYLLKLVEFNKIAILEKYGYAAAIDRADLEDVQLAEIQSCMTRLMRQRLL